jgi:aminoglycoside phosphotransferase (APT) family kinase protein
MTVKRTQAQYPSLGVSAILANSLSPDRTTGRLLARGRAADVFEAGPGRVLRRYRPGEPHDAADEAAVMEHARRQGFPVPKVHDAGGTDIVLERINGPTMLADLGRRPWRVRGHGALLASLHRRLHAIPAPAGLRCPFGRGECLVHLDLHPDNVLLSDGGPVVIDWSNASRGEAADDVALTWVIVATSVVEGPAALRLAARFGRDLLLKAFLAGVDAEPARGRLAEVAVARLETDQHLRPAERRALEALVAAGR